jgi:hypothetical protein
LRRFLQFTAALALACASSPPAPAPAPGRATLVGTFRLVPHQGVKLPAGGAGGYADPRLRDARLVDYSRPGFAVVYLERGTAPAGTARIAVRASEFGARFDPEYAALGADGLLTLANETSRPQVVSIPSLGAVRRLEPGGQYAQRVAAGAHDVFLLGADSQSSVFAAPGPFARVEPGGHWELRDLEPGLARVRTWHPRFPAIAREVELVAGRTEQLALEVGVDRSGGDTHASP